MKLVSFAGVTLPEHNRVYALPPASMTSGMVSTPAGPFDAYGWGLPPAQVQQYNVTMLANESSASTLQTTLDTLRGLMGQRGTLLVETRAGELRWQTARLLGMDVPNDRATTQTQQLTVAFEACEPWWRREASNLCINGGFSAELDEWTISDPDAEVTVQDGALWTTKITGVPQASVSQTITVVAGHTYRVTARSWMQYLVGTGLTGAGLAVTGLTGASTQAPTTEETWETLTTSGVASGTSITVTLTGFDNATPAYGGIVVFDDVEVVEITTLASSPTAVTITADGNAAIDDLVITVTAGGAAITALEITNVTSEATAGGVDTEICDISYDGTIVAGKSLVIDCGAYSVENDGSDAMTNLTRETGHEVDGLFELRPGVVNTITVTFTGGSTDSTAMIQYEARWR